jgi:sulfotransferase
MMARKRQFYFLGGLPRAGSTLLCNILAQNPDIHCTHTSGCMDVMFGVRNNWNNLIEHKAHPEDQALQRVLRGILYSYYSTIEKPIVIDKCRGWLSLIEMAELALEDKVKIIVPVRDIRDVLTSFEKLWRENAKTGQVPGEAENYFQFQNAEGRADFWLRNNQPVGLAVNRIRDALQRGYADRMHFVHFEELTASPQTALLKLYCFLDEPVFPHNFDNVEQVTWEDDSVHGFKGLHSIRPKVAHVPSQWREILGTYVEKYGGINKIWER